MGQVQVFTRSFLRGLETTRDETGAPDWSGFRQFKNIRVGKDQAERRGGTEVVTELTEVGQAKTLEIGHSVTAKCLAEVWALDRPNWALDFLFKSAGTSDTAKLFDSTSLVITTAGGNWSFAIGSAILQAPVTANTDHLALVRDKDGYHLLLEGVEVDAEPYSAPATPGATLTFGEIAGVLDFFRLRAPGPASWAAREIRLLNPRGRGVLACYRDAENSDQIYWDSSIYEAHGRASSQLAGGSRLSKIRHMPVQGMQTYVDENDRRRLMVVAGGQIFDAPYE